MNILYKFLTESRFESCALPQAVHHNRASVARHEIDRANYSLALKRALSSILVILIFNLYYNVVHTSS